MQIIELDISYFLGKTVYPEDAYYSSIDWVSSNPDIVSVDSNGKITGVSVGSADITATIGSISQNVTVAILRVMLRLLILPLHRPAQQLVLPKASTARSAAKSL